QCRAQGNEEAALQIAVEALDFALGTRSIGLAHPQLKTVLLCHLEHAGMPAMQLRPIGIALDNDRLGVVEQHLARYATEVLEGSDQAIAPICELLGVRET